MCNCDKYQTMRTLIGARHPRKQPAMWFDGADDLIRGPSFALPDHLSMSASIYLQAVSAQAYFGIISQRELGSGVVYWQFVIKSSTRELLFAFHDGTTYHFYMGPVIALNTWCQAWVWIDVNTVLVGRDSTYTSTTVALANITNSFDLRIGYEKANNGYFTGVIRDVVFWDGDWRQNPAKLGAWRGYGNTVSDWADSSGNGHHMTSVVGSPNACQVHRRGAIFM